MIVTPGQERSNLATTVTITLKGGRELSRAVASFKGTPERPLDRSELREKFLMMAQRLGREAMESLFDRLQGIENENTLAWLSV
jgi:2-methylcitrate dehydratase PrpD